MIALMRLATALLISPRRFRAHRPRNAGDLSGCSAPGLVSGAAEDDPSGIATHSQVGAQFGYGLAWTMLFSFPLMAAIQAISAQIGCVIGRGIASNLRRYSAPWLLRTVLLLLIVANVINLGADLGAMGAAVGPMVSGPEHLYTLAFGVASVLLQVFMSYDRYAATPMSLSPSPRRSHGERPSTEPWFDGAHAMALVAVLGTTISPYLFFWQAGQEVEELHCRKVKPLYVTPRMAGPELARIRIDTLVCWAYRILSLYSSSSRQRRH